MTPALTSRVPGTREASGPETATEFTPVTISVNGSGFGAHGPASVILGGMSTLTESQTGRRTAAQAGRLRMASFGVLTMLILQFALGTAYNLYGTAPTAFKSVGVFSSPLVAIHVILGILI